MHSDGSGWCLCEAGGGNYQTLINLALRDFVSRSREPLENTLQRVIREELKRAGCPQAQKLTRKGILGD